jgi:diaminohydroxyphosphoribosylaminopyrimidine deaminase/5-amino-6-(5-phosphoribosylamino)uracil reductase
MRDADCTARHPDDQAAQDRCFMAEALAAARAVSGRTWPNPPVGAVVVADGVVVGRGAHEGPGKPHAEPVALAEAGDRARDGTLYVTLEPCNHEGRTGPCAPAVVAGGVKRVVVAMRDPNPTVAGGGLRHLRDRGLDVTCGVGAEEALELIWPFVATDNFTHPYVELKTALSLDGRFAPARETRTEQAPVYLTGEASRRDVHARRRRVDLVLVGEGTVKADRPRLDGRLADGTDGVPAIEPLAGYVDTHLSWTGGFARDGYLVFAGKEAADSPHRAAIEADGGIIIFCEEDYGWVNLKDLVRRAALRGMQTIMVEGGPRLAASFLEAGLVDRWVRYLAPVVLGRGVGWAEGGSAAGVFSLTRHRTVGDDLLVIHDKRRFADVLAKVTV